ncbi:MAG: hypothetical protein AAFQ01_00370 [Bacteroidota bacterium]
MTQVLLTLYSAGVFHRCYAFGVSVAVVAQVEKACAIRRQHHERKLNNGYPLVRVSTE